MWRHEKRHWAQTSVCTFRSTRLDPGFVASRLAIACFRGTTMMVVWSVTTRPNPRREGPRWLPGSRVGNPLLDWNEHPRGLNRSAIAGHPSQSTYASHLQNGMQGARWRPFGLWRASRAVFAALRALSSRVRTLGGPGWDSAGAGQEGRMQGAACQPKLPRGPGKE